MLSQLVVNFLDDADAGVSAMRDAARPGGVVTGVVWDYAEGMTMLRAFWDAALQIDPDAPDEARTMRHSTPDALADLWRRCGLEQVATQGLTASASYASYDDFWEPFTAGIGPAGAYCAGLPAHRLEQLRLSLRERIGSPPGAFELDARAWLVRGRAPDEPPGARFGR